MHSNVTIKNVSWPHFSWPTRYNRTCHPIFTFFVGASFNLSLRIIISEIAWTCRNPFSYEIVQDIGIILASFSPVNWLTLKELNLWIIIIIYENIIISLCIYICIFLFVSAWLANKCVHNVSLFWRIVMAMTWQSVLVVAVCYLYIYL